MQRSALFFTTFFLVAAIVGCHDKDPSPEACKPHSLLYETDSIVYTYAGHRITTVIYYGSGVITNRDEFTYDSEGRLSTVAKLLIAFDGSAAVDSHHTITYDGNGRPKTLATDSYSGHYETGFTHNDKAQLASAETTYGDQHWYVGTTRYEYDDNGNVPKVYYTLNLNGKYTEVLARENLSFDNKEKFYVNTPELKVLNEYVYGYLPNKNNCLGSTVYYYSYAQHFASPLSINFVATYDDKDQIRSLQSDGTNTKLYSGEVLFKTVVYNCD